MSDCKYAAAEVLLGNYDGSTHVYTGLKAGYENAWGGFFNGAIEGRVLTDFNYTLPMITPKAGLTIYNIITLMYGYNIFDNSRNRLNMGHHQVSISINYNKVMLH